MRTHLLLNKVHEAVQEPVDIGQGALCSRPPSELPQFTVFTWVLPTVQGRWWYWYSPRVDVSARGGHVAFGEGREGDVGLEGVGESNGRVKVGEVL